MRPGSHWVMPGKPKWVRAAAEHFERMERANKPTILLPQAFGPFERPEIRSLAGRAIRAARLIIARDPESHRYVSDLVPGHPGLRQYPDFTNLLDCVANESCQTWSLALLALSRMRKLLKGGCLQQHEAYVSFMARSADRLCELGCQPFIVLHETRMDKDLACEIAQRSKQNIEIIVEDDVRLVKYLISQCVIVISSRFHGAVNGLSQGIPTLGTSWSHKYVYLFEDYGRSEWLIDPIKRPDAALNTMESVLNNHDMECSYLANKSNDMKRKVPRLCGAKYWRRWISRLGWVSQILPLNRHE